MYRNLYIYSQLSIILLTTSKKRIFHGYEVAVMNSAGIQLFWNWAKHWMNVPKNTDALVNGINSNQNQPASLTGEVKLLAGQKVIRKLAEVKLSTNAQLVNQHFGSSASYNAPT